MPPKSKWEINKLSKRGLLLLKLFKKPSTTLITNLLRVSMTRMNNKGNKGSPCLIPLELGKKPDASALIKIEKREVEMQNEN